MASKSRMVLALLVGACLSNTAAALAIADSDLAFSNLDIDAGGRTVSLLEPWTLDAFAEARNSLGELDQQSDITSSPGTAKVAAAVTHAEATGEVAALADPPAFDLGGTAASAVDLPGCGPASASAKGRGTAFSSFAIEGSGSVTVQIAVDVSAVLEVLTDVCGVLAETETVFALEIDGTPVLFLDRLLAIGRSDHETDRVSERLTATLTLEAGTPYFILLEADSESRAVVEVPAPSAVALLLAGLAALRRRPGCTVG